MRLNIGDFSIKTDSYTFDFYCYDQSEWDATDLSSAEEKNAISPIGILEYNDRRLVFTGDSNELNEPVFMESVGGTSLDCDVLKVGHHGSATSSTAEFLSFIDCEYAVISCNASGNDFHHPTQATLDRLKAEDMTVYRTDLQGNIVLTVDKDGNLSFTSEKTADNNALFVGAAA